MRKAIQMKVDVDFQQLAKQLKEKWQLNSDRMTTNLIAQKLKELDILNSEMRIDLNNNFIKKGKKNV